MRVSIPGVESPPDKIHFSFEGKDVEARRGDTVAASLLNGGLLACREVGDGSYRGIFCGMGACNECAVVVNGEPGHLACMIQSEEGMVIEGQPSNPPHPDLPPAQLSHVELSPAVLVVGGGPAGLSAAATIAAAIDGFLAMM